MLRYAISFIFVSMSVFANHSHQEIWDTMYEDVGHWTDRLGYPIDCEIKEAVVALNVMGIKTKASCEGHLDRGFSYPWINIHTDSPEQKALLQEITVIYEEISKKEAKLLDENNFNIAEEETLINLWKKSWLIIDSLSQLKMEKLEPLNQLLNQFYEKRNTSYDKTLIVNEGRLQSIGADRQQLRTEEEQFDYLNNYREEMKSFTQFLKKKFMN